jgi:hypothetical protein
MGGAADELVVATWLTTIVWETGVGLVTAAGGRPVVVGAAEEVEVFAAGVALAVRVVAGSTTGVE